MTRISAIDPKTATGRSKELLEAVRKATGTVPNMIRTMANSPAVLDAYLAAGKALSRGVLDNRFRQRIALAVSQANGCEYCLAAHSTLGKAAGLTPEEMIDARRGRAADDKTQAGLDFALELVKHRGHIADGDLSAARRAGYSDAEIAEIVGHVALTVLTNYFNLAAGTEVDFPKVAMALGA